MTQITPALSTQVLQQAPVGLAVLGPDAKVTWCNAELGQYWGQDAARLLGQNLADLEATHLGRQDTELAAWLVAGNGERRERWLRRFEIDAGTEGQRAVMYVDVSNEAVLRAERDDLARQLRLNNTLEPVSGLLNNRSMLQALEPLVSRSRRYSNPLSVVTLGVSNLDTLHSRHGPTAGAAAVRGIGQVLKDKMRWADLVSQVDDTTFVCVLPETDGDAALRLAEKLSGEIRNAGLQHDGHTLDVQACFGVTAWGKGDDSNLLLRHSREAMQAAAKQGAFAVHRA